MESNALRGWSRTLYAGTACLVAVACSDTQRGDADDAPAHVGRPATGGAAAPSDFGNAAGSDGSATSVDAGRHLVAPDGGLPDTCAVTSASAKLEPVYLAFAFDVSGSMGKGDEKWHDKSLKWDPVVAATRAFFEDAASQGLTASLTFFPAEGDDDERCVETVYEKPDVAMTALPSNAFGDAIAAIEPKSADDWRGGTPTAWVMRGTRAFIASYARQARPLRDRARHRRLSAGMRRRGRHDRSRRHRSQVSARRRDRDIRDRRRQSRHRRRARHRLRPAQRSRSPAAPIRRS